MEKKINSFVITNISKSKDTLILKALVNGRSEKFAINIRTNGTVSLPDNLELLIISKEFNDPRKFLKVLSDYQKGLDIELPLVVFANSSELTFV